MATFTTQLKTIIEPHYAGEPAGQYNAEQYRALGLDTYPIFDEDYRDTLNNKIIDHYYTAEIGSETVERFRMFLRSRMNEIMPAYNKLYRAEIDAAGLDPLQTMRVTSEGTTDATNTTSGTSVSASNTGAESKSIASDFPQSRLNGDGDYATSGQDAVSESNVSTSGEEAGTASNTATTSNTTTGSSGQVAVLLARYRELVWNLDADIIAELGNLFMQIWTNGDDMTDRNYGFGYHHAYGFAL